MSKDVTKRILLIDNDPSSTRMVRLTLERNEGFQVHELNDPTRALSTAGVFGPDLILLDVGMPGLTGGDVARRLRAVPGLKTVPVVFMTSLLTEGEAAGPLYSGGSCVLAKPTECVAGMLNTLCAPPAAGRET